MALKGRARAVESELVVNGLSLIFIYLFRVIITYHLI